ncbi:hypothetical protein J2X68_001059 [Streptomyces sp. 3330]|nr:hypothetical protein [Streptomyces sp. 3330]MDR6974381.1 hypothetical protein [Streptomyces sp. 3330]
MTARPMSGQDSAPAAIEDLALREGDLELSLPGPGEPAGLSAAAGDG